MTAPVLTALWNTIVHPAELVDGKYHIYFSGVYNPLTQCGIHRGRPAKTWARSYSPAEEDQCQDCLTNFAEWPVPRPPFAEEPPPVDPPPGE